MASKLKNECRAVDKQTLNPEERKRIHRKKRKIARRVMFPEENLHPEAQEHAPKQSTDPNPEAQEHTLKQSTDPNPEAQEHTLKQSTDPNPEAQEHTPKQSTDPNPEAQEHTPKQSTDPNNTGGNVEENLASFLNLREQIEVLTYQFKMAQEQNEAIKLLHQDDCEKACLQMEQLQKQHKDQLQTKDKCIKHLRNETASVQGQLDTANKKVQTLIDIISNKTQDLKKAQLEKQDLSVLVDTLHFSLNENEGLKNTLDIERKATEKAQSTLREMETQNQRLMTEVTRLKSALERKNTKQAQAKLKELEREKQQQNTEVSNLKSALEKEKKNTKQTLAKLKELERQNRQLTEEMTNLKSALRDEQAELQTLRGEKVDLESTVTKLELSLSEEKRAAEGLRSTVKEQKATTRALNQRRQTERFTFCTAVKKCYAEWVSALAEKDQLMRTEEQKRNVLQGEIKELSVALTSSDETNSALKRQNQELQDYVAAMEQLGTINRQKKR
ncbi:uncharacterized protein [Eucyclogobius newberryi]|uniref:uncharacterized protein n=1 Tax=Eucyclogobius newberryi TaxID=166745 RepID=UPI003B5A0D95